MATQSLAPTQSPAAGRRDLVQSAEPPDDHAQALGRKEVLTLKV